MLEAPTTYLLRTLGTARVQDQDGSPLPLPVGKPFALLVYLAVTGAAVERAELARVLWPRHDPRNARQSVRQALFRLRRVLGSAAFVSDDPVRLAPGAVRTDLDSVRDHLEAGRIAEALVEYEGPFLAHFAVSDAPEWDRWADTQRACVESRVAASVREAADRAQQEGRPDAALEYATQAVVIQPLAPEGRALLIDLLLDRGSVRKAEEALAEARIVLWDSGRVSALDAVADRLGQARRRAEAARDRLRGPTLELTGRSRELAALKAGLREAQQGSGHSILITGPGGVGKTRMVEELLAIAESSGATVVKVTATAAEHEIEWGLAADLVHELSLRPGAAGVSSQSERELRALVSELAPERAPDTKPRVSGTVVLAEALLDLVAALAYEETVAVVVDDLQHADPSSAALAMRVARQTGGARVLWAFTYRVPEGVDADPPLCGMLDKLATRRLELGPLSQEEVEEAVELAVEFANDGDTKHVAERLYRESSGNPLHLIELLRELRDRGFVVRRGDAWRYLTGSLSEDVELPPSVRALAEQRMARLSPARRAVAGLVAASPRGTRPDELRRLSGLDEGAFHQALSELLKREILVWSRPDSLRLVSDEIRDASVRAWRAHPARRVTWKGRLRAAVAVAAVAGLLLASLIVADPGADAQPTAEGTPPFGGGVIVLRSSTGVDHALQLSMTPSGEWESRPLEDVSPEPAHRAFMAPDGSSVWFGATDDAEQGPDIIRVYPNGDTEVVVGGPGDHSLWDISPDAQWMLYSGEIVDAEAFDRELFVARIDGTSARLLHAGGRASGGGWSSDGDLIAYLISARDDTVAVVSRDGDRVRSFAVSEVRALDWCGDALMVAATDSLGTRLQRLDVERGTVSVVSRAGFPTRFVCSPDGTAVVHTSIEGGRLQLVLRDVERGETRLLPVALPDRYAFDWVVETPAPVPIMVEAAQDTFSLGWGDRGRLRASVHYSDGTEQDTDIHWTSLNPNIAGVDQAGVVTANRGGRTRVVAGWGYSFRDTVEVLVEGSGAGGTLLRDSFVRIDTMWWIPLGSPRPVAAEREGEPALLIPGDEKYTDGLLGRIALPLERGVTVGLEFRLPITRAVYQDFSFCLVDSDPSLADPEVGVWDRRGSVVCFVYPAREMEKRDPKQAAFLLEPGAEVLVGVPPALRPGEWTHVAIQIRADGETSLFINRQRAAVSPVRLRTQPQAQWSVLIEGAAVDTELAVRNLSVWEGLRHSGR